MVVVVLVVAVQVHVGLLPVERTAMVVVLVVVAAVVLVAVLLIAHTGGGYDPKKQQI